MPRNHASPEGESNQVPELNHPAKDVISAYLTISYRLNSAVERHLEYNVNNFHSCRKEGSLNFKHPILILEQSAEKKIISASVDNDALNYKFLMFRTLAGAKALKLAPEEESAKLMDGSTNTAWTAHNLLNTFEYKNAEGEVISSHTPDGKINPEAGNLLKAEKFELTALIKNIFHLNSIECNTLKNADHYSSAIICNEVAVEQSAYFINFMTCMETFNLVQLADFCD